MVNMVPVLSDWNVMVPEWASITRFTMAKPKPVKKGDMQEKVTMKRKSMFASRMFSVKSSGPIQRYRHFFTIMKPWHEDSLLNGVRPEE